MSCNLALTIVAAGGALFAAIGIYAVILQAKWMNRPLEQDRESEQ